MTEPKSPDAPETPPKTPALNTLEEILTAVDAMNWRLNQLESDVRALRRDTAAAAVEPKPKVQLQEPGEQPAPPPPPTGTDRIARLAAAVRAATAEPELPEEELMAPRGW